MTESRSEEAVKAEEIDQVKLGHELRGNARKDVDELLHGFTLAIGQLEAERPELTSPLTGALDARKELDDPLARLTAQHQQLEQRLQRVTDERDGLLRSFDDVSEERERLLAIFEEIKREREETLGYTERLEQELGRLRDLESMLTQALIAAERSGSELRAQAQREAESIFEEARAEARKLIHEAASERERLVNEMRAVRAMVQAALATLDERRLQEAGQPEEQSFKPQRPERALDAGSTGLGS